ncbi:hypothetical protein [Vibrio hepatarius]|uniref:hypothetical protein n=1 Tax=Vibrio hepatarius TaxID=171383 RepID=UPI00142E37A3|nr:hypothetical protein [Vibrio hepatarius]NIY83308.1 hypothetical protein [Vibrio hepatarius]
MFTKLERKFIFLAVISIVALFPLSVFRLGLSPLYHGFNFLAMLILASLLVSLKCRLLTILKTNLLIVHFSVLIYIFMNLNVAFPLEEMIEGVSSNGITLFVLILSIHYSIVQIIFGEKPSIVPALFCVCICYVGWGRTSMIVSLAYLSGLLFFLGFDFYHRLKIFNARSLSVEMELFVFTLLILSGFSLMFISTGLADSVFAILNHTKIGAGLYDTARVSIIEDYLMKMDLAYFISGGDYKGTVIEQYFRGNPHNTLIRAHYIFGIFYLVFTIVPLVIVFFVRVRFDRKILVVLLFSLFYIRSLTETVFYPTVFDVYIFIVVFLVLEGYQNHASQKQL